MEPTPAINDQLVSDEAPQDLLEQLAAKRKLVSDTKETYIPVPGYDREPPVLLIRYRLLEGPELQRIADRIRRQTKGQWERAINAAVDTFIAACVGFYVDISGNGTPEPLTYQSVPIMGFTHELAEALKFANELPDPETARSVVFGLFANNDVAISQHNFMLNRWMTDTSIDVTEEMFLGNP